MTDCVIQRARQIRKRTGKDVFYIFDVRTLLGNEVILDCLNIFKGLLIVHGYALY